MSRQCVFDWQLLMETGNGYRCLGCLGNTAGAHCERCKEGYYRQQDGDCCLPCRCHPQGMGHPQGLMSLWLGFGFVFQPGMRGGVHPQQIVLPLWIQPLAFLCMV